MISARHPTNLKFVLECSMRRGKRLGVGNKQPEVLSPTIVNAIRSCTWLHPLIRRPDTPVLPSKSSQCSGNNVASPTLCYHARKNSRSSRDTSEDSSPQADPIPSSSYQAIPIKRRAPASYVYLSTQANTPNNAKKTLFYECDHKANSQMKIPPPREA